MASLGITTSPDTPLDTGFVGTGHALFWLGLKTGLLTILTLGMYRFWMKTRLRRWYWSAVRPGGTPLEYVGEPLEKLLGFLIAVVFLAFYLGIVNLLLMFVSFSVMAAPGGAYLISLIGVIPLWFYAQYRARRYVLARTRWRGLRFALEAGAWGYAIRALGHWLVTILSLGLMWPRMTFSLEKYKTDRTFFGSARLHQGGKWRDLYPSMVHVIIGVVFSGLAGVLALMGEVGMLGLWVIFLPWLAYGLVHYRVETRRRMANAKTAGGLGLIAKPRAARVFRIQALGNLGVSLVLFLPFMMIGAFIAVTGNEDILNDGFALGELAPEIFSVLPRWVLTALAAVLYFTFFLMWSVLNHVWITMPTWRHYAQTLQITGHADLADISQRERDEFAEAEGFAEALDVGAAI